MQELSWFETAKVLAIVVLALGAMYTSNVHAADGSTGPPTVEEAR